MLRWTRRLFGALLFIAGVLIVLSTLTARSGNPSLYPPASEANAYDIFVVSHGYHAGIVLRARDVAQFSNRNGDAALIALGNRFNGYEWLEIGWGDESFYTQVPDVASLTVSLAFKALFLPGNRSVLHVVGLSAEPHVVFHRSQIVQLRLGEGSFAQLLRAIDGTFAREPDGKLPADLSRGLYGPSLFYRAVGEFNLLKVCNHWVADMLDHAGVPTTPVIDTLPQGLLFDLKWRAGALLVVPAKAGTHDHRPSRVGRQVVMGPGLRSAEASLGRDAEFRVASQFSEYSSIWRRT